MSKSESKKSSSKGTKVSKSKAISKPSKTPISQNTSSKEKEVGINEFLDECFLHLTTPTAYDYIDWKLSDMNGQGIDEGNFHTQFKASLKEMLSKNVSKEAIIDIVMQVQHDTLEYIFQTLEGYTESMKKPKWALYILDDKDNPSYKIGEQDLYLTFYEMLYDNFDPKEVAKIRSKDKSKAK